MDKLLDLDDLVNDLLELAARGQRTLKYDELRKIVASAPCLCWECRALSEKAASGE